MTDPTDPGDPNTIEDLQKRIRGESAERLGRAADAGFLGNVPMRDQVDHSLGFVGAAELVMGRPPRSVLDIGTGGGIPGFVLIECWPDTEVVLLDSSERRTEFLQEEVERAGLQGRVQVIRGRAEEIGRSSDRRERFELVTARSFAPPPVTAECGSPFLEVSGRMIVSEPPDVDSGSRWPAPGLEELSLEAEMAYRFDGRFGYQVLRKTREISDRYPRRSGIPAKRPVF